MISIPFPAPISLGQCASYLAHNARAAASVGMRTNPTPPVEPPCRTTRVPGAEAAFRRSASMTADGKVSAVRVVAAVDELVMVVDELVAGVVASCRAAVAAGEAPLRCIDVVGPAVPHPANVRPTTASPTRVRRSVPCMWGRLPEAPLRKASRHGLVEECRACERLRLRTASGARSGHARSDPCTGRRPRGPTTLCDASHPGQRRRWPRAGDDGPVVGLLALSGRAARFVSRLGGRCAVKCTRRASRVSQM